MSIEENKAIVRRLIEDGFNQQQVAVVDDLVAMAFFAPHLKGKISRPDSERPFSQQHYTIDELIAEGDRVVVLGHMIGVHTGLLTHPFGSVPPTGTHVTIPYQFYFRVAGGKITGFEGTEDAWVLLHQLGVLPP